MKTKILSFVTCLLFLVTIPMVSFASDSNVINNWFNVLDYSLPNNGSNRWVDIDNDDIVSFDLPYNTPAYDFDLLIRTQLTNLHVYFVANNGYEFEVRQERVGDYIRLIGSGWGFVSSPFKLRFTSDSGGTVFFEQFKTSSVLFNSNNVSANGHVELGGSGVMEPSNGNFTWDPDDFVQVRKDNNDNYYYAFEANLNITDWYKFDYIVIDGILSNIYLTSISSEFSYPLDMQTSYYTGMDKADTITSYSIIIDTSSLPKNSLLGEAITIKFGGTCAGLSDFYIYNITGYLASSHNSFLYSIKAFFNNLGSKLDYWFNQVVDLLRGNSSGVADQFESDMESQGNELDQMVDDMTAVTLPDIDDIEIDISDMDADFSNAGDILSAPLRNELIFRVFYVSATFALAGYVLYGKR